MSVFGHKNREEQGMASDAEAISSLIDKSMTITGTVSFAGKARIDGLITGDVEGEHLILSETGKILGNVKAATFTCHGTLDGDIQANNVIARKSCSIHGRLEATSLTVEPGAAIDGEIKAAAKELRQQIEGKIQAQLPFSPGSFSEQ